MPRLRKITAAVSATALLGAGGIGIADAASTTAKSSSSARPGAKRGPGQMSATQVAAIAKSLGVTSAQLRTAMKATRPAKPAGDGPDRGAGMATELATALGVDVARVQTILDANRPAKPAAGTRPAQGAKPPKPDHAKLIAALATGLSIDEATVKAAFDKLDAARKADHAARETAMYAALAKELGLETSAVKAAFEANRPAKPAK